MPPFLGKVRIQDMNNLSLSDLHQATSEELLLLIIGIIGKNMISLLLHIVALHCKLLICYIEKRSQDQTHR